MALPSTIDYIHTIAMRSEYIYINKFKKVFERYMN